MRRSGRQFELSRFEPPYQILLLRPSPSGGGPSPRAMLQERWLGRRFPTSSASSGWVDTGRKWSTWNASGCNPGSWSYRIGWPQSQHGSSRRSHSARNLAAIARHPRSPRLNFVISCHLVFISPQFDPVATTAPVNRPTDHATTGYAVISDRRGALGPCATLRYDGTLGSADSGGPLLPGESRSLALAGDGPVPEWLPTNTGPALHPWFRGRQDTARRVHLVAFGSLDRRGPLTQFPVPGHVIAPSRRRVRGRCPYLPLPPPPGGGCLAGVLGRVSPIRPRVGSVRSCLPPGRRWCGLRPGWREQERVSDVVTG